MKFRDVKDQVVIAKNTAREARRRAQREGLAKAIRGHLVTGYYHPLVAPCEGLWTIKETVK